MEIRGRRAMVRLRGWLRSSPRRVLRFIERQASDTLSLRGHRRPVGYEIERESCRSSSCLLCLSQSVSVGLCCVRTGAIVIVVGENASISSERAPTNYFARLPFLWEFKNNDISVIIYNMSLDMDIQSKRALSLFMDLPDAPEMPYDTESARNT
jgi:hypothetical protein